VVVVDDGRVIADDTADALKAELAGDQLAVTVADGNSTQLKAAAERLPGAKEVVADGDRLTVRVADGPAALPSLLAAAQQAGVPVTTAQVHRPTLDDVFLNLTGRSLRETGTTRKVAA
jgi:ABC-2 type transport system ATP-binding protein